MPTDADKNDESRTKVDGDVADDWFGPIDALIREYEGQPRETASKLAPRLADLHGLGVAKEWAENLLRDLRDFRAGHIPLTECDKGCLLVGPPGTGKTTLAKAVAHESGVPFIATSAATWLAESYLGQVIQAVRNDFATARQYSPSIIFIDEIDGLTDRTAVDPRYRAYWNAVVGCVLEEIDGVKSQPGVIVIGATNHPQAVDRALLRSGRLDRVIEIDVPDPSELEKIIRQKLGSDLLDEDLKPAAVLGLGGTGADAERWVRGARRQARYESRDLTVDDLVTEICGGVDGIEADLLRRCAIHEAGHAVAAVIRGEATEVYISLLKSGSIAGSTRAIGREEALTLEAARRRLTYVLAGRAAEEVVLGSVSGGAGGMEGSDLALATRLAIDLVTSLGLAGPDPLVYWGSSPRPAHLPPHLFTDVRRELNAAYKGVCDLIETYRLAVSQLSGFLMVRLAASDLEIRTIIREHSNLPETMVNADTRH